MNIYEISTYISQNWTYSVEKTTKKINKNDGNWNLDEIDFNILR